MSSLKGKKMKEEKQPNPPRIATNAFVIGMTFFLTSWWLMGESRPYSSATFHVAGMVCFVKDILDKFKNKKG